MGKNGHNCYLQIIITQGQNGNREGNHSRSEWRWRRYLRVGRFLRLLLLLDIIDMGEVSIITSGAEEGKSDTLSFSSPSFDLDQSAVIKWSLLGFNAIICSWSPLSLWLKLSSSVEERHVLLAILNHVKMSVEMTTTAVALTGQSFKTIHRLLTIAKNLFLDLDGNRFNFNLLNFDVCHLESVTFHWSACLSLDDTSTTELYNEWSKVSRRGWNNWMVHSNDRGSGKREKVNKAWMKLFSSRLVTRIKNGVLFYWSKAEGRERWGCTKKFEWQLFQGLHVLFSTGEESMSEKVTAASAGNSRWVFGIESAEPISTTLSSAFPSKRDEWSEGIFWQRTSAFPSASFVPSLCLLRSLSLPLSFPLSASFVPSSLR